MPEMMNTAEMSALISDGYAHKFTLFVHADATPDAFGDVDCFALAITREQAEQIIAAARGPELAAFFNENTGTICIG